jgi:hypothetical protein
MVCGCVPSRIPRLEEEDRTMSDRASAPDSRGGKPGGEPDGLDDAREAALMREVLRAQERHREGGIEPGLDAVDADAEPDQ